MVLVTDSVCVDACVVVFVEGDLCTLDSLRVILY